MGEIIAFQSTANPKRPPSKSAGEGAQILFFTGVRYVPGTEQASEADAPRHDDGTPRGGRRRRER